MSRRLTSEDRHFGPITYARSRDWCPIRLVYSSGGDDDSEKTWNHITAYAFGWVARIKVPDIIQPHRVKHVAHWDAATVARIGRDWYYETHAREYGFSISSNGFVQVFYGEQTMSSDTEKLWCMHMPWTQWRHVRFSLYDLNGAHFWSEFDSKNKKENWANRYEERRKAEEEVPSVSFMIEDDDGQKVTAKTHIQEREWKFGERWFKWLSLFRKNKIHRSLDIEFSAETGPEKGSWKGGTMGCSIEMLPGELHEAAFIRYCDQEHRSKHRKYKVKFLGVIH